MQEVRGSIPRVSIKWFRKTLYIFNPHLDVIALEWMMTILIIEQLGTRTACLAGTPCCYLQNIPLDAMDAHLKQVIGEGRNMCILKSKFLVPCFCIILLTAFSEETLLSEPSYYAHIEGDAEANVIPGA
ncbi:hypothetical protein NPIL_194691 [Nephila pilipes]|uniref:Uncharacterized protein n=1 Tax=Nephila pilipes TaxID=299642 RepID=A0A8X6PKE3_NEPPI|nr:hypothetical protein NPIL_194691 [Nephila pilipes]